MNSNDSGVEATKLNSIKQLFDLRLDKADDAAIDEAMRVNYCGAGYESLGSDLRNLYCVDRFEREFDRGHYWCAMLISH